MNREEQMKMWTEAAMKMQKTQPEREMGPHDKAISDRIGAAKKAGRELTPSEKQAIERHRQNAWNAEKRS